MATMTVTSNIAANHNLAQLGHILSALQVGELAEPLVSPEDTIRKVASVRLEALDSPLIDDPVFRDRSRDLREQVDRFERKYPAGVEIGALFQCDGGAWIGAGIQCSIMAHSVEQGSVGVYRRYKPSEVLELEYLFNVSDTRVPSINDFMGKEGILAAVCVKAVYCGIATVDKLDVTYHVAQVAQATVTFCFFGE